MNRLSRVRAVIDLLCVKPIPLKILRKLDTDYHPEFQDWVCSNMKPELEFSTGDALINAAVEMADSTALECDDD